MSSQVINMFSRQPIIQSAPVIIEPPKPKIINSVGVQAIIDAISFPVEKTNTFYEFDGQKRPCKKVSIVRTDTGVELGSVGAEYGLVSHGEALAPILEAMDGLNFGFKGVAMKDHGRRILVEAVIPDEMVKINGDDHMPRMILTNSYDGSTSIKIECGFWRMVCMNGMMIPEFVGSTFQFKTTHKKQAGQIVEKWREACSNYSWIKESQEAFKSLIKPITEAEAKIILAKIFVAQKTAKNPEAKENKHVISAMQKAISGQGQNGDLTAWSLYNGITETIRDQILEATPKQQAERLTRGNERTIKALELLLVA